MTRHLGAAAAALLLFAPPAAAQSVADFYRGRTVTISVGLSAGGGYDLHARVLARFLGKHLPGAPAVVDMLFTGAPVTISHIKAGRLKLLAVTDSKRAAALPDTPTVGESLPGYEFNNWYGIMAPVGTPRGTIDYLNAEVQRILTLPEVKEKLAALGADPTPSTPEKFGTVMATDAEKWGRVIKQVPIAGDDRVGLAGDRRCDNR